MKRAFFVVLACACSTPRTAVEIAAPLSSATTPPTHDEVFVPREAKRVVVKEDGAWAAQFPAAKTFAVYDLPDARVVLLTWRVGHEHFVKRIESDGEDDYPANHVRPIDLVVQARAETRTISFGELSGAVQPAALSWCASEPRSGPLAATFSIGLAQGDDDMAIVRDKTILHVLHRETSDGKCDETKQGPLDVCEGFEWQREADIRVGPRDAVLWEIAIEAGKPFVCSTE